MAISTGAALLGVAAIGGITGLMGADKAAGAQEDAAKRAEATQRYMYDTTREDNKPFYDSGVAANNQLSYLLGLSTTGGGSANKQYESGDLINTGEGNWKPNADLYGSDQNYKTAWDQFSAWHQATYGKAPNSGNKSNSNVAVDQLKGFGFDLDAYNAQAGTAATTAANADPNYGALMKKFSETEFKTDPGYEFRLGEGQKGINNSAAASGGLLSGATLKALSKYNQDFSSNEYSNAYNRYNTDQTNQYNKLAGLSGAGQQASNTVGNAGQNMANNVSNIQQSAGDARASGYVGGANAITGAIGQGYNMYQQSQLMNKLYPNSGSSGGPQYVDNTMSW